ncbi:MAG TPA: hypothetical protein VKB46_03250 [Pyrinomonadaceae bacterium]|nr:hypothetical protein [Pyrinomonadaceae bacterium]
MISDCYYCGILELNELGFFADTLALLQIVVPGATIFALWRIFVTNKSGPPGDIVVIGLDDSSSIYSDQSQRRISLCRRFLYCLTTILTFAIGLLAAKAFEFLQATFP